MVWDNPFHGGGWEFELGEIDYLSAYPYLDPDLKESLKITRLNPKPNPDQNLVRKPEPCAKTYEYI